jgi:hypothetical protein
MVLVALVPQAHDAAAASLAAACDPLSGTWCFHCGGPRRSSAAVLGIKAIDLELISHVH